MTLFYPDLSNYQAGYKIPSGTPAVVAKATEGTYYLDSSFHDFQSQAAALGVPFSGYHFLKSESSPEAQAQYYHNFAGKAPCMIDCETSGGSRPGVDWCQRFIAALSGLGGRVWSVYYPGWYLGATGGSLAALGVPVIASEYRSYDDNHWPAGYGGIEPVIWQFTSTPIDMNAFRGTPAQLAAIINGDDMDPSTTVNYPAAGLGWYPDVKPNEGLSGPTTAEAMWGWTAVRAGHIIHQIEKLQASVDALATTVSGIQAGSGASPQAVAAETLSELKAKL